MYSCLPEQVIENYNQCMRWSTAGPCVLDAYLFWGAEYWLLRDRQGDPQLPAGVRARPGERLTSAGPFAVAEDQPPR